jgi:hypothetical protein
VVVRNPALRRNVVVRNPALRRNVVVRNPALHHNAAGVDNRPVRRSVAGIAVVTK